MAFEPTLRQKICDIGRHLYERGHNAPGDGNISARLSERYLLATPTMKHKGALRPDQIVKLTREGRVVESSQAASSEIRMHLRIYEIRPDVGAIVHAHSPNTVALTVAGISMAKPVLPEIVFALGEVHTVPYASPTTTDVPDAVARYARESNAFILERHGPVALGATLDEALSRLEVIEHTARIMIAACTAGGAPPLPDDEIAKLRALASQLAAAPKMGPR